MLTVIIQTKGEEFFPLSMEMSLQMTVSLTSLREAIPHNFFKQKNIITHFMLVSIVSSMPIGSESYFFLNPRNPEVYVSSKARPPCCLHPYKTRSKQALITKKY